MLFIWKSDTKNPCLENGTLERDGSRFCINKPQSNQIKSDRIHTKHPKNADIIYGVSDRIALKKHICNSVCNIAWFSFVYACKRTLKQITYSQHFGTSTVPLYIIQRISFLVGDWIRRINPIWISIGDFLQIFLFLVHTYKVNSKRIFKTKS